MSVTTFDIEINDVDGEIFRRIDNTDVFINKYGILHKRDTNELKDIKTYKIHKGSYIFKINGKIYYLNKLLKELFNINLKNILNKDKEEDYNLKQLFKEKPIKDKNIIIESIDNKIMESGHYKNHPIIKYIPNDLIQVKEYNGILVKSCYYYSNENINYIIK